MSAFMSAFASLVGSLADLLQPLFHGASAAAAIILFTALVRLAVHPLSRAAARGQKARTRLQPQVAELRKKHGKNPERMQKAIMELHAAEKVSPLSGCLPSLLQMPAFFLLYHLFSSGSIGGEPNALLSHDLLGARNRRADWHEPSRTAPPPSARAVWSTRRCSSRSSSPQRSVEQLLRPAPDVDRHRGVPLPGHRDQQTAERERVVVGEVREREPTLLGDQLGDRGGGGRHAPCSSSWWGRRVTETPSRAERRAASRTSRASAAWSAVTGFSPVERTAAVTAA
ncbi:Membrane protein insertase YidC [Streptomyces microflavus]